jgi:hypothetical protein
LFYTFFGTQLPARERESRREKLEPSRSRENQGKPLITVAHSFSKAQNMLKILTVQDKEIHRTWRA